MKKPKIIAASMALFITVCSKAQTFTETPVPIPEDTLTIIAKPTGTGITWDFSGLNFSGFPDTRDSDLVQLSSPTIIYNNVNISTISDSLTALLPIRVFSEDSISLDRIGGYIVKYGGNGTLKIPGHTYTNVDKMKITELYRLQLDTDTVVTYTNNYYEFFDNATHTRLLSVNNKKRLMKGMLSMNYYGIGFGAGQSGNSGVSETDPQMTLSPNPATGQTTLTFILYAAANCSIDIINQTGTVNNNLFTGPLSVGPNQRSWQLQGYQPGLYTVKLTIAGVPYTTVLIVQ